MHGLCYHETVHKEIKARLNEITGRISGAAERVGRDPVSVRIMAVTKTHPLELIAQTYLAGVRCIGENRVQEAVAKLGNRQTLVERFPGMDLHMIGHLQSNKARDAVALFDTVQSVDSLRIATALAASCDRFDRRIDVLLEINSSGEENKYGFTSPEALFECAQRISAMPQLTLRGVMTIAPYTTNPDPIRSAFALTSEWYNELNLKLEGVALDTLSMGMSNDYEIAVEEGSTMVRLGTELFGVRE